MKAEIARYNELCYQGLDVDFGKTAKRLIPVENPPFYARAFGNAGMLVMFVGLGCDRELHVTKGGTNDTRPWTLPRLLREAFTGSVRRQREKSALTMSSKNPG